MADYLAEEGDQEELLSQTHKKEKKALQAEIQRLKHSIPKGDKKKKKSVTEEIAKLEADLAEKHKKELAELKEIKSQKTEEREPEENGVGDGLKNLTINCKEEPAVQQQQQKKTSKAQKRRNKKAAQATEREERIREQEIDNLTSSRHVEAVKIKSILGQRGLQIHEIPSDGNCLYAAISHQLHLRDIQTSTGSLRSQTADYMRRHQDDFMPFLTKDNGDMYTSEDFEDYCHQIESSPAWGGQLEIQALSNILRVPIEVVQSEGPSVNVGENQEGRALILTYYRHAYGLGEHYHSVEDKVEDKAEDFT